MKRFRTHKEGMLTEDRPVLHVLRAAAKDMGEVDGREEERDRDSLQHVEGYRERLDWNLQLVDKPGWTIALIQFNFNNRMHHAPQRNATQRNSVIIHHDDYHLVSDYDIMPSVIMSISSGRRAGGQAGGQAGGRAG
eukprot:COSAG06_NODE_80_length_25388_cov_33.371545_10_plen_136_part_00